MSGGRPIIRGARTLRTSTRVSGYPTAASPRSSTIPNRFDRILTHLAVAVTGLMAACGGDENQAAPAQDRAPFRPATESLFDSSEHPDLSELLEVTAGFFLPDTGLALVDPTVIHIVDLSSGETRLVGGEGEGPEEFGRITGAVRTLRGFAVWDILRHRVASFAHDGEFLHSQGYLDVPFKGFMNVRPVAAHPDGSIVFRDEISGGIGEYKGRLRHPAQFVAVRRDGSSQVVAEAQGDEEYYGKRISDHVILGHRTLEAAAGDRFIVAETGRGAIAVLDWSGRDRLPGQDSVTWRVWDIEQARLLFTARMDAEDTLLDARGDLVLLRRLDEFDVPRAVVSRLRAPPD